MIDGPVAVGLVEAELGQDGVDPVLVRPALSLFHGVEERRLARQRDVEIARGLAMRGVEVERAVDFREFGLEGMYVFEQSFQYLQDGRGAAQFRELREISDRDSLFDVDRALGWLLLTQDQLQCGRLARSVLPDQADAVPGVQTEEDLPENRIPVERLGDILEPQQAHGPRLSAMSGPPAQTGALVIYRQSVSPPCG